MFKNLTVYRLASPWNHTQAGLEELLGGLRFEKCGPTQEKSVGWVEPRGIDNAALVESVAGHQILKLMIETKVVPSRAVADRAAEEAKKFEETNGRKMSKKEMRDLKDELRLSMLPMAFTKSAAVLIWIDPSAQLLMVDSASQARIDEVMTFLVKAIEGLAVQLVHTETSTTAAMASWLATKEAPAGFTVDRECELRANDESKAVVRYTRHSLDSDEVAQHIAAGKTPTKLAMTYSDRVSFLLTDTLQLKKIAFLDGVIQDRASAGDKKDDAFDADVAITTGELVKLLPDLFGALGGFVQEGMLASKGGSESAPSASSDQVDEAMYEKAVAIVLVEKKASISLVQRHLRIGYNAAARLIEQMEARGLVTRQRADGSRAVIAQEAQQV